MANERNVVEHTEVVVRQAGSHGDWRLRTRRLAGWKPAPREDTEAGTLGQGCEIVQNVADRNDAYRLILFIDEWKVSEAANFHPVYGKCDFGGDG